LHSGQLVTYNLQAKATFASRCGAHNRHVRASKAIGLNVLLSANAPFSEGCQMWSNNLIRRHFKKINKSRGL